MSKGLESLNKIMSKDIYFDTEIDGENLSVSALHYFSEQFEIIEKELKRLEQYDIQYEQNTKWLDLARKKLKALEIIKSMTKDKYSKFEIDKYNTITIDVMITLDDEEIDLLKEVLE